MASLNTLRSLYPLRGGAGGWPPLGLPRSENFTVSTYVYRGSLVSRYTNPIQEIFPSIALQRTCKRARSPLFSIKFPLTQNQKGLSPHQIVLQRSSRTPHTTPPATYPTPWRARAPGLRLLHHARSIREQLRSTLAPTNPHSLRIFVRWNLPQMCMCTLPCTLAHRTHL